MTIYLVAIWTLCILGSVYGNCSNCKLGYACNIITGHCEDCSKCPSSLCPGCPSTPTPGTTPRGTTTAVHLETHGSGTTDTPPTVSPSDHVLPKWAIVLMSVTTAVTTVILLMIIRSRIRSWKKSSCQPPHKVHYQSAKDDVIV